MKSSVEHYTFAFLIVDKQEDVYFIHRPKSKQ